ncbi:MAG: hypothetical protein AB1586_06780 [Pseudomonadota bacterium]|jgi:hypothetical protein
MPRTIVAHRIHVSPDGKTITAIHERTRGEECLVQVTFDPDGNPIFGCASDGCSGECQLRSSGTEYWCACVVPAER